MRTIALGLAWLLSWCCVLAHAQGLDAVKRSVVKITSQPGDAQRRTGTGFVVRVDGDMALIATASHVVAGDKQPRVEFFSRRNAPVNAEVIKTDRGDNPRGMALLLVRGKQNLPQDLQPLGMADASSLSEGDEVTTIGFPARAGEWAVIKANITARQGLDLNLSGPIEEGNSGGPLLKDGSVMGMVMEAASPFGTAIPVEVVSLTLKGWGVQLGASAPAPASVEAQRPARAAGVKYRLRRSTIEQGHGVQESARIEIVNGTLIVAMAGMQLPGTGGFSREMSRQIRVVAAPSGKATRLELKVLQDDTRFTPVFAGQSEESRTIGPLQGKTLVAEKRAGAWQVSGAQLSAEDIAGLTPTFDAIEGDPYPSEALSVGDTWEVVGLKLNTFLGFGASTSTSGAARFKLERINQVDGEPQAEISVELDVRSVGVDQNGAVTDLALNGSGTLIRSLRNYIDLSSSMNGRAELKGGMVEDGVRIDFALAGPFTIRGTGAALR